MSMREGKFTEEHIRRRTDAKRSETAGFYEFHFVSIIRESVCLGLAECTTAAIPNIQAIGIGVGTNKQALSGILMPAVLPVVLVLPHEPN